MNRIALLVCDGTQRINRITNNVEHATECSFSDWHRDWATSINGFHPAHHAVSGKHRHCTHASFTEVLLHFSDNVDGVGHFETFRDDAQGLIDWRQIFPFKLNVENRTDYLNYFADMLSVGTRRRHTLV